MKNIKVLKPNNYYLILWTETTNAKVKTSVIYTRGIIHKPGVGVSEKHIGYTNVIGTRFPEWIKKENGELLILPTIARDVWIVNAFHLTESEVNIMDVLS